MLKGWRNVRVLLGAKSMARQGAPPRIVLVPTEGAITAPRHKTTAVRDVDRRVVAHLWGSNFDELDELETRLMQALDYQAAGGDPMSPANPSAVAGTYWKTVNEVWNTDEDSSRQGEEVYVVLVAINPLNRPVGSVGEVDEVTFTQTP